jgi:hypothetical protein
MRKAIDLHAWENGEAKQRFVSNDIDTTPLPLQNQGQLDIFFQAV